MSATGHRFTDDSPGRQASHCSHVTGTSKSAVLAARRARTKRCGTNRPAAGAEVLVSSRRGGFERAGRGSQLQWALLVDGDGASL